MFVIFSADDGVDRAKKCLQRSMHFDKLHPKAGSTLSRLYRQNNQTAENLALLQNAVEAGRYKMLCDAISFIILHKY